jgi:hypothetical protein
MVIGLLGNILDGLNGHTDSSPVIGQLAGVASLTVAALVVSRRPTNRIGWLFLLTSLLLAYGGAGNLADQYAYYTFVTHPGALPGGAWVLWLGVMAQIAGFVPLASFLLLLFPDGRLLSPRWRLVAWAAAVFMALNLVSAFLNPAPSTASGLQVPNPLGIGVPSGQSALWEAFSNASPVVTLIAGLPIALACVASALLRFRRSRGDERQQLKWFAMGVLLIPLAAAIGLLAGLLNSAWLQIVPVWQLGVAGIPIATGIAILKYRLYDIDLIIRRTLLYALLTGLLAAVYFGSVVALQSVFTALTGAARSELVTVLSTLAIATLFVPLRRRLQAAIDRRFNRQKYNAAQTLAEFGATLRDEVDLDHLSAHLLVVVEETMQPETVSLWIRGQPGTGVNLGQGGAGLYRDR